MRSIAPLLAILIALTACDSGADLVAPALEFSPSMDPRAMHSAAAAQSMASTGVDGDSDQPLRQAAAKP